MSIKPPLCLTIFSESLTLPCNYTTHQCQLTPLKNRLGHIHQNSCCSPVSSIPWKQWIWLFIHEKLVNQQRAGSTGSRSAASGIYVFQSPAVIHSRTWKTGERKGCPDMTYFGKKKREPFPPSSFLFLLFLSSSFFSLFLYLSLSHSLCHSLDLKECRPGSMTVQQVPHLIYAHFQSSSLRAKSQSAGLSPLPASAVAINLPPLRWRHFSAP